MKVAQEVQAHQKSCVPGATSPGVVREFSFAILAYGLRGLSQKWGGGEGSLRFTSGFSHLSGFVLWNLCVGVVSMATSHLQLVVLMVMLPAAHSVFSDLYPLGLGLTESN